MVEFYYYSKPKSDRVPTRELAAERHNDPLTTFVVIPAVEGAWFGIGAASGVTGWI